jgi:hypothetical protein
MASDVCCAVVIQWDVGRSRARAPTFVAPQYEASRKSRGTLATSDSRQVMQTAGISAAASGKVDAGMPKGTAFPGFHDRAIYLMDSVRRMDHEPIDRGCRSRCPSLWRVYSAVDGGISAYFDLDQDKTLNGC